MSPKIKKIALVLVLISFFMGSSFIYAQMPVVSRQNNIRIDEKTGVPAAIYNVKSKQYSGTPEQIARQYLNENSALLKMTENLEDLELIEIKKSPAGNHVAFRQVYQGIPVMGSEMVVSINHQNRVSMVVNHHKPDISVNPTPSIGKDQALSNARQTVDAIVEKDLFQPNVELMVFEDSVSVFHLIWKVIVFPSNQAAEWLVIVDAHNSEILKKVNMVFNYVTGAGRAFNPDPGTELRDTTLPDSNDVDYETLQPAYDNVSLFDLNNAIGEVYKVRGRYAWSQDIYSPHDTIIEESDPDNFVFNRSQYGFEEVNIYYFIDKQRRYLDTLGFSPTWKYLDPDGSETVVFDARGESDRDAHYSPSGEFMYFGVPSDNVDAGEDQSVILHEYGHALHDALINGSGTDYANSNTRGISEGIAEYTSVSYRRTTQANPFRSNYRSNWFYPEAGTSIRTISNAKYPDNWGSSEYDKMKVWASTLMDMEYNTATDPTQGTNLGRDITTRLMLTSVMSLVI